RPRDGRDLRQREQRSVDRRDARIRKIPPTTGVPRSGAAVYAATCVGCHGINRRGKDRAPSLIGIGKRLSTEQLREVLEHGRGFMPSFANLSQQEKRAVTAYLLGKRTISWPPPKRASNP